jgi:tRNA nucleotidyltransferase (CCA-adding enzyme)
VLGPRSFRFPLSAFGSPVAIGRVTFPSSLPIPDSILAIVRRLEEAGHETWCVGGAVRDNLLGIPNHDFDIATAATPDVVRKLFRRTVPVGVEHGTVGVLDDLGRLHEVTTFRKDVATDGRHATVAFGASLDDDLARRDFTINAIAYHPIRQEWRDPFDGLADLMDHGVIRAVGDPQTRFREDHLRIVRALRFSARFGFPVEETTWKAAKAEVHGLKQLSAERVRDEWFKGLETAQTASRFVEMWREIGALGLWLPEIQLTAHRSPLTALDAFPTRDPVLLTAHLSGDPEATLRRLRCSNAEIERGRLIGQNRDGWPTVVTDLAVRHWLAQVGPAADDLLAIAQAEGWGGELAEAAARIRHSKVPLTIGDLAITGSDIIALGIPEGPDVGVILHALLDLVIEHPEWNTREELIHQVTALTAEFPVPPEVRKRLTDQFHRAEDE